MKVRMEERRYRKPSTLIEGLQLGENELTNLCKRMKREFATGGTVKDGIIILQGDKREEVPKSLEKNGFSRDSIEIL